MLKERIAVITGGAKGIGRATANLFVQRGATVIIGDMLYEKGDLKKDEDNLWVGHLDAVSYTHLAAPL